MFSNGGSADNPMEGKRLHGKVEGAGSSFSESMKKPGVWSLSISRGEKAHCIMTVFIIPLISSAWLQVN